MGLRRESVGFAAGDLLILIQFSEELVQSATSEFDCLCLTPEEQGALPAVLDLAKAWIEERHQPDGYNVGMNCGEAAGQTVMHFHCHLIPRTHGDTPRPRGGVRGVIPSKQSY